MLPQLEYRLKYREVESHDAVITVAKNIVIIELIMVGENHPRLKADLMKMLLHNNRTGVIIDKIDANIIKQK